jgi:hypothetical protein
VKVIANSLSASSDLPLAELTLSAARRVSRLEIVPDVAALRTMKSPGTPCLSAARAVATPDRAQAPKDPCFGCSYQLETVDETQPRTHRRHRCGSDDVDEMLRKRLADKPVRSAM